MYSKIKNKHIPSNQIIGDIETMTLDVITWARSSGHHLRNSKNI